MVAGRIVATGTAVVGGRIVVATGTAVVVGRIVVATRIAVVVGRTAFASIQSIKNILMNRRKLISTVTVF